MKTFDVNIKTIIANAAEMITPLWPMQTIIARNPLQSMESLSFEDAIAIGETFLAANPDALGSDASEINREVIKWCQVFLDEGQATITMPEREKGFYRSWSLLAPFDHQLRPSKNDWLLSLPSDSEEAIIFCLKRLAVPEEDIENYLKISLAELPGWAGYIKWRAKWQHQSAVFLNPITLTDFLAVRLVITCAIETGSEKKIFKKDSKTLGKEFFKELKRKEEKYLRKLLKLVVPEALKLNKIKNTSSRPDAQLVFCIDVRSEPFRKRIEGEGNYETFGFAGFFGLPVSIHSYNKDQVRNCCPVLLKPSYEIFEEPIAVEKERISHHQIGRSFLNMCQRLYQNLKYNFATPFALVETLGFWCGFWMALRTIMPISSVKFRKAVQEGVKPTLATLPRIDIPLENQINFAESALRLMGLTKNFSRLVVLCGHKSQTENNAYASALDCGACGGNHGGANGKILAAILNSCDVRRALLEKEIAIPDETLFLGAEHNTTTDEVVLEDHCVINSDHKKIVENLKRDLIKAGIANSHYRCKGFGMDSSPIHSKKHVSKRGSDWAEVRPEWGLAKNAAFIIGPRSLTKELDLDGRCFLHSYEWGEDEEGNCLENILTAPMVVAEWINMQYFFSALNNVAYGSGSKITHNVTGKFGIMQGNSSDLMQGLPLQSVNINDDLGYHEPMRLQVVVYSPRSRINAIIEKHPLLQNLFFNHWIFLVSIDPIDSRAYRLIEKANWREIKIMADINSLRKLHSIKFATFEKVKRNLNNEKTYVYRAITGFPSGNLTRSPWTFKSK